MKITAVTGSPSNDGNNWFMILNGKSVIFIKNRRAGSSPAF
ncbi:MAG: hypothetical protein ACLFST_08245 [Spirochaetia bacterium]